MSLRGALGTDRGGGFRVGAWGGLTLLQGSLCKTKYWIGGDGRGDEDGSVSQCVVWLQKQQLKTGLEKRLAVDMALCAISSDSRQSETVEPHSDVPMC